MNIDTKHLRELRAKATEGEWVREWNAAECPESGIDITTAGHGGRIALVEWDSADVPLFRGLPVAKPSAEADIIVVAVNNLVPLCDEVDRLRAQLAEAKALLRRAVPEMRLDGSRQDWARRCDALLAQDGAS